MNEPSLVQEVYDISVGFVGLYILLAIGYSLFVGVIAAIGGLTDAMWFVAKVNLLIVLVFGLVFGTITVVLKRKYPNLETPP